MFDGVWRAVPGDEFLLSPSPRELTARVARSGLAHLRKAWLWLRQPGPRDLTVRFSAVRPHAAGPHGVLPPCSASRARRCRVHRSPIRGSWRRTTAPFAGSGWPTHTPKPNFG